MRLSVLLAILPLALASPTGKRSEPAPLLVSRGDASNIVADHYIVKFKSGSSLAAVEESMQRLAATSSTVFNSVFQGFSGHLNKAMLDVMRSHPDISNCPICSVLK